MCAELEVHASMNGKKPALRYAQSRTSRARIFAIHASVALETPQTRLAAPAAPPNELATSHMQSFVRFRYSLNMRAARGVISTMNINDIILVNNRFIRSPFSDLSSIYATGAVTITPMEADACLSAISFVEDAGLTLRRISRASFDIRTSADYVLAPTSEHDVDRRLFVLLLDRFLADVPAIVGPRIGHAAVAFHRLPSVLPATSKLRLLLEQEASLLKQLRDVRNGLSHPANSGSTSRFAAGQFLGPLGEPGLEKERLRQLIRLALAIGCLAELEVRGTLDVDWPPSDAVVTTRALMSIGSFAPGPGRERSISDAAYNGLWSFVCADPQGV